MGPRALIFPRESRFFPGQRWVNVLFRTLHLVGLGGLGAGFLYPAADDSWRIYLDLVLLSGVGLMLISLYSNGIWLLQLRGQVILLKLLLLAMIPLFSGVTETLFILVILLSGWISHATGDMRYYSPFHRRRIDFL
jgi:hypothetical protein